MKPEEDRRDVGQTGWEILGIRTVSGEDSLTRLKCGVEERP